MRQGVGPIEDDFKYLDRFPGILENSKFLQKKNDLNFYHYPCYPFNNSEYYKTILFIGETGYGKTSSINFFLNYYLGVQFEDNIRFQLINEQKQAGSQAVNQTQNVNIYYVKPINGNEEGLRIVDTPGFNDTRGIDYDKIILDKIKNCFQKDIDSISAVCFLIKASETRLTSAKQYVFSQILQIFGKDIVKNFIFLFPFFVGDEDEEPGALQIVNFKGDIDRHYQKSLLADIYEQMVEPKYINYNNTTLYSKNDKASSKEKWNYFMNQFNVFKNEKLEKAQPVSLQLTKMVIVEREKNMKIIKHLRTLIHYCLSEITFMKETYKAIVQHDSLQQQQKSKQLILENIINDYLQNQAEYYQLQNEFQNCARRLQQIALKPELSSQQEMDYFQKLLQEPLNNKQKETLNEILADFKMIQELEQKGGDSQKIQDFTHQLLKAKKEGSLKGLLLNQP